MMRQAKRKRDDSSEHPVGDSKAKRRETRTCFGSIHTEKPRTTGKVLVFPGSRDDSFDFAINGKDFRVINTMMTESGVPEDMMGKVIREIVHVKEDDEERRVDQFGSLSVRLIPDSTGRLGSFKGLNLESSRTRSLPFSVELQNLLVFVISSSTKISRLPESIADLTALEVLNLCGCQMRFLNPSVGKLQSLKHLNLSWTKIATLPDEIGDLSGLKELNLSASHVRSLPASVGRLSNLQRLDLSYTRRLVELPPEIGHLTNLTWLRITEAPLESLPCLANLERLQSLDLEFCDRLAEFPHSILGLTNLLHLNLNRSHIEELRCDGEVRFLLRTVRQCQSLGYVYDEIVSEELEHLLARNRARHRAGFLRAKTTSASGASAVVSPRLWPRMLATAERAFAQYPDPGWPFYTCPRYWVERPDAIYQLLVDGRESFLSIARERNQRGS